MTLRVYGRTEYDQPLVEQGVAEDSADVRLAYSGEWVEMVAFAEDAVHWIIRDGERVDDD
jgi:hypothetical protein